MATLPWYGNISTPPFSLLALVLSSLSHSVSKVSGWGSVLLSWLYRVTQQSHTLNQEPGFAGSGQSTLELESKANTADVWRRVACPAGIFNMGLSSAQLPSVKRYPCLPPPTFLPTSLLWVFPAATARCCFWLAWNIHIPAWSGFCFTFLIPRELSIRQGETCEDAQEGDAERSPTRQGCWRQIRTGAVLVNSMQPYVQPSYFISVH